MTPVPSHTTNVLRSCLRGILFFALLIVATSPLSAQEVERNPVDDSEGTVDVNIEPEVFVPTMQYVEESDETVIDDDELSITT